MTKLVMPTRNRPTSISGVLNYLAQFYPGTQVVIADGSGPDYHNAYKEAVAGVAHKLEIDHRIYGPEIAIGERMVDALASIEDEFVILGADDDYPVIDNLLASENFLRSNQDYILAIGGSVIFRLLPNGDIKARLCPARPIRQRTPVARLKDYKKWQFPTSYGLVKRSHCIERYARNQRAYLSGFADYSIGFHDLIAGRIKAIGKITYFQTRNEDHSLFRRKSDLFYLERAAEVLDLKDHYQETLVRDVGISQDQAQRFATKLINDRIGNLLTPSIESRPGFGQSPLFDVAAIRQQHEAFHALFSAGSSVPGSARSKIRTIIDCMMTIAEEGIDNLGEPKIYNRLQDMNQKTSGGLSK